jgi:riboflavin kinase/FMN adenylyltransferase
VQHFINETGLDNHKACIALGMFDGVHLGHAALLENCVALARKKDVPSVVYTYSNPPHPQKMEGVQGPLTTQEEKIAICEQMGFDMAVVQPFTPAYAATSPAAFVGMFAVNDRASALVCGTDYRFGAKGSGNTVLLGRLGGEHGIEIVIVDDLLYRGSPISSTRIRAALLRADMDCATKQLGRPYSIPVDFQKGRAAWPHKARVKAGEYGCIFEGRSIIVSVEANGIIASAASGLEDAQGMLCFVSSQHNVIE